MLVNRFFLILTFLLLSQASFGGLTHKEVLKNYSLEQLDSVANLLMLATDLSLEGKSTKELCSLSKDESLAYINEVKALVDKKFKSLKRRVPLSWEKCDLECHCGMYSRFGEVLNTKKLLTKEVTRLKLIEKKAIDQSKEKLKSCVAKTKWFCKSPLLQYLKSN